MINETAFIGCDNCPPEMAKQFDRPWNFVGEVEIEGNYLNVICMKCMPQVSLCPMSILTQIVSLRGHWFITDDMVEVQIFLERAIVVPFIGRVEGHRFGDAERTPACRPDS